MNHPALDVLFRQRDAWNRGDRAGYLAECAPDIVYVSARGAAFGLLHWATSSALAVLPLLVSMGHDACVLVEDDDFVDALTGKPPRHPDTIPRSPSGRLM
jgi:hypothetical protein